LAYASVPRNTALTGTSYICGLRQNETDRANVALVNAGKPGDGDVILKPTLFSGDPANPVSKVLSNVALGPGAFSQLTGILQNYGVTLTNGWLKLEKVGGNAPYFAY